ncbi:hypothetical protein FT641_17875 [Bacillus paranthracis]|uniref:hypothetical protein n=1 Tax=Bacillus paranthracis TaxID=2026186 RepID=UPI00187B02D5|nr:hypothetical protein [Bacillus paranthracis]MBE7154556.1 hypothetical protein [Bacillus paranthracis]
MRVTIKVKDVMGVGDKDSLQWVVHEVMRHWVLSSPVEKVFEVDEEGRFVKPMDFHMDDDGYVVGILRATKEQTEGVFQWVEKENGVFVLDDESCEQFDLMLRLGESVEERLKEKVGYEDVKLTAYSSENGLVIAVKAKRVLVGHTVAQLLTVCEVALEQMRDWIEATPLKEVAFLGVTSKIADSDEYDVLCELTAERKHTEDVFQWEMKDFEYHVSDTCPNMMKILEYRGTVANPEVFKGITTKPHIGFDVRYDDELVYFVVGINL